MADLHKQRVIPIESMGAVPLPDLIDHVVGTTATLVSKPSETGISPFTGILLKAERGNWRLRLGDRTSAGMPSVEYPAATQTDDAGSWLLAEGESIVLPALSQLTVKGFAASSILTYGWL